MKTKMGEGEAADSVEYPTPDVPTELVWVWRAYSRLENSRVWHPAGMGTSIPGGIPLSAILQWADYRDYDQEMTYLLDECIRDMDRVYLDHQAKKGK